MLRFKSKFTLRLKEGHLLLYFARLILFKYICFCSIGICFTNIGSRLVSTKCTEALSHVKSYIPQQILQGSHVTQSGTIYNVILSFDPSGVIHFKMT